MRVACAVLAILFLALTPASGYQEPKKPGRFTALGVADPSRKAAPVAVAVAALPSAESVRAGWEEFRAAHGAGWEIHVDRRSGAPLLAKGPGLPWIPGSGNSLAAASPVSLDSLEASLRVFMAKNRAALLAADEELVLDRAASGQPGSDRWQVIFDHLVGGVPVAGDRYVFEIGHGNLISFGASRWTPIAGRSTASLSADDALARLRSYMGLTPADAVTVVDPAALGYYPLASSSAGNGTYAGPIGAGYRAVLAWRVSLRVAGDDGTWVGLVDARSGAIFAFYDDNKYGQVRGGVYPVSNDQSCPDGCEQTAYPMPFSDVTINGSPTTSNGAGIFPCTPVGGTATTMLSGPYVRVTDTCGAISQSATCDADLDFQTGPGTDCATPAGASPGNTHASRTGFYHLNRIIEKARSYLPGNTWLTQQLTDNVNINNTCNAFWDGTSVNFYRSGGGCRNTGEIAGVFLHEWGHGLDDNDGGGAESPGEAYADITALLQTHVSCLGRGFDQGDGNCSGYGNTCLDCSGIREADWDKKTRHAPSTALNIAADCGPGTQFGPCGLETHCEGQIAVESLWDLAERDLPAAGYDHNTAWQVADKLWYTSRLGSGGDAYTCAGVVTTGCMTTSWFMKFLAADDDDGNLANGTPHAAAIFAAFDRHSIACGAATDASNQSTSSCPALGAPVLSAVGGSGSATLSWTAVPGAASYTVLRNDAGCSAGYTIIAHTTGTSYTDPGLANDFTEYYAVQAIGSNTACEGSLSNCQAVTPQGYTGTVRLGQSVYTCSSIVQVLVTDGNIGAPTTTVAVSSGTETTPQVVTLVQSAPGSVQYTGTITTTSAPPANDGLLSVTNGDTITVRYVDADDGAGHTNVPVLATAAVDCAPPVITNVQTTGLTGRTALITWVTNENADSVVHYGTAPPGGSTASLAARVTAHAVPLIGLTECTTYYYWVQSTDKAGNTASNDNVGSYYTFRTLQNTELAYASADTPVSIPDVLPTGAASTITVTDTRTVQDINVKVNITHTAVGDLTLSLVAPNGTSIALANGRGGSGDNFRDTVFDDEAATPISAGSAPFTGSFQPETPLSAADGISAAGGWKLMAVDGGPLDTGTIDNWTLILTYPPETCGASLVYQSSSVTDACGGTGSGGGNGIVDPGEDLVVPVTLRNNGVGSVTGITATLSTTTPGVTVTRATATYPNIAAGGAAASNAPSFGVTVGTGVACGSMIDFKLRVSANEGTFTDSFSLRVGSSGVVMRTFTSSVPTPVPDLQTVTSTISVTDTSIIRDVDAGLSITHTYDSDLQLYLIGPNGTRVELSTGNGGTGDNYTGTIFDDEASTPITSGSPPFTGRFRPEGSLATLDGIPSNGTWTLEMTDSELQDSGLETTWSITLTSGPDFVCGACSLSPPTASPLMHRFASGSKTGMVWEPIAGASFYNVYRGAGPDLPNLLNASVDSCRRLTASGTATGSVITEMPAPGSLLWYLVRAANAAGEGPAGQATAGTRIQNASGECP